MGFTDLYITYGSVYPLAFVNDIDSPDVNPPENPPTVNVGVPKRDGMANHTYLFSVTFTVNFVDKTLNKQYTFKFKDTIKITKKTKVQLLITGSRGNVGGISVGYGKATWKNCYWTVEEYQSE